MTWQVNSRRVILAALLMIFLTTLPYLVAVWTAPQGTQFSGTLLSPVDYNSHLAKMQQGQRGEWLYSLLFTTEPHQPALLQTFYLLLGHIARITTLPLVWVYHLARIICIALMVWVLWLFMRRYLPEAQTWYALLLALFGGGLGFLLILIAPRMTAEISPIEFWLSDAYIFLSSFLSPHFVAGIALLALSMLLVDRWVTETTPRSLLWLCLSSLGLAIVQPFDLLLVDSVLVLTVVLHLFLRRGNGQKLNWQPLLIGMVLIGVLHGMVVAYQGVILYTFPVWREFTEQNITLSPPPIYYLMGYAPLLLPAFGGLWLVIKRKEWQFAVPVLWMILVAVLIYAPLNTQRRYLLGIQAPMALLAVYWLANSAVPYLRRHMRKRYRYALLFYGVVATLSTIITIAWLTMTALKSRSADVYVPNNFQTAWTWIEQNTPSDSVFLAGFGDGGKIPAQTGRRVVLGHWIETIQFAQKQQAIAALFSPDTDDAQRITFLDTQQVNYVWYANEERGIGTWQPDSDSYLTPVYQNADVVIYQYRKTS